MTVCNQNRVDCDRLKKIYDNCTDVMKSDSCPILPISMELIEDIGSICSQNPELANATRRKRQAAGYSLMDQLDLMISNDFVDAENLFMNHYMTVSCGR